MISARLLNIRFGKEPVTGALSHSIVNQTVYFGFKATRLITSLLFNGLAASDNNRCSNWAGGFLLSKNRQAGPSADTLKPALTKANPEVAMANKILSIPLPEANLGNFSETDLSALLDLLTSQIEYHRDELTRLRPILHRIQAQIPNQPFTEFINDLQEI